MSRIFAFAAASAFAVLACAVPSQAQVKAGFIRGLEDFVNAAAGAHGDEGPALNAALEAMAAGLTQWDATIARVEDGLASEIGGAAPPAAARMRTTLGAAYLERGRLDAALAQFDAAIRLGASLSSAHLLRGLVYRQMNQVAEAEAAFRAAWEQDPKSGAAAYLFLQAAANRPRSAETSAAFEALAAAADRSTAAEGQFPDAAILDETSLAAPVFPLARYSAGVAFLVEGEYGDAISSLRRSAADDPLVTDPALRSEHLRRAATALRQDDTVAAIAAAEAGVKAYPSSSEANRVLGLSLWAAGQYDRSVAAFRMAIRLYPRDERSLLAVADVLVAAGNPVAARDALNDAMRVVRGSGLAAWKLARLHQALGEQEDALRSYQTAAVAPALGGGGHVYAALGRMYHNRLDLDAAAAAYAQRIQVVPNDSAAHFDLGDVLRSQGRLPEALVEYLAAAILEPSSARAFAMIGLVHASAGRDAEAYRALRRAVTLDPSQLEARYALSRALLRLGRADDATRELEAFRQLQAKAMEEERRRFRENQRKIDDTLRAAEPKVPGQ